MAIEYIRLKNEIRDDTLGVNVEYVGDGMVLIDDGIMVKVKDLFSSIDLLRAAYEDEHPRDVDEVAPKEYHGA